MSTPIKGFPSNNKVSIQRDVKYATVEPVFLQKDALSVKTYQFARLVGSDAVEAGTTTDIIVATAHAAQVGDVISFTSGTLSGQEFSVASTSVNAIVLSEKTSVAASAADTFDILRHKVPIVSAAGGMNVVITDGTDSLNVVAEDSPHVSGDTGIMSLAVRNDGGAALAGTDGDYIPLTTDATGALRTTATIVEQAVYAEDSAHTTGDNLKAVAAVRNDAGVALAGTDLDYIPLSTDNLGNLRTNISAALPAGTNNIGDVDVLTEPATAADGAAAPAVGKMMGAYDGANLQYVSCDASGELQIDILSVIPGVGATNLGKAEDAVHASGDVGVMSLAVRQDATAPLAADGDYTPLQTNASGELKVAATFTEQAVFAEDSVHASGDIGKFVLAVRNDAASSLVSADGDYAPLQVDATGNLKVAATITEQAVFAEDSAHTTGDNLKAIAAVRNDAGTVLAGTDLDYIPVSTDANGDARVVNRGKGVVTTTRNDYSSTNVTTGAWVELIASTASIINEFEIFDSSGETLELGTGAAAAETRLILVFPGGNGRVPVRIASGTRISIRAVSATASVGELDINWYS